MAIFHSYVKLPEAYFISLTRIQLTLSVDVPILNQSLLSGGIGGQNLQETIAFTSESWFGDGRLAMIFTFLSAFAVVMI